MKKTAVSGSYTSPLATALHKSCSSKGFYAIKNYGRVPAQSVNPDVPVFIEAEDSKTVSQNIIKTVSSDLNSMIAALGLRYTPEKGYLRLK
jgi:hypothetical protein